MEPNQKIENNQKVQHSKEEVEIMDLLRVIWKWKYLIIAGTFTLSVAAIIITLNMQDVYRVEMIIQPGILSIGDDAGILSIGDDAGILSIGDDGKKTLVDKPENIKALIETKIFNSIILHELNLENIGDVPKSVFFDVRLNNKSNTIKVTYDNANPKQGVTILNLLGKLLKEKYDKKVQILKSKLEMNIDEKRAEIDVIRYEISSNEKNIKNIQKRIAELKSEIVSINSNLEKLLMGKSKFVYQEKGENGALKALLYSNNIKQDLKLVNEYRDKIISYQLEKENQFIAMRNSENQLRNKIDDLNKFTSKVNNIQNIQIVKPPTSSEFPIKPKKAFNFLFATVASFFLFVFLSFILEYLLATRKKI